jgi:hypothetical protein
MAPPPTAQVAQENGMIIYPPTKMDKVVTAIAILSLVIAVLSLVVSYLAFKRI